MLGCVQEYHTSGKQCGARAMLEREVSWEGWEEWHGHCHNRCSCPYRTLSSAGDAQEKVPKSHERHKPAGAGSWFSTSSEAGACLQAELQEELKTHSPSVHSVPIYACLVKDLLSSLAQPFAAQLSGGKGFGSCSGCKWWPRTTVPLGWKEGRKGSGLSKTPCSWSW